MAKKNLGSISTKRTKANVMMPSGQNTISGNLYDIVETISKSMKEVESGTDLLTSSLGDVENYVKVMTSQTNRIPEGLSEGIMSIMGFVSGGESINKNSQYSSIKNKINEFTKKMTTSFDVVQKLGTIIDPGNAIKVISVTNESPTKSKGTKLELEDIKLDKNSLDVIQDLRKTLDSGINVNLDKLKIDVEDINFSDKSISTLNDLTKALNKVVESNKNVRDSKNLSEFLLSLNTTMMSIDVKKLKRNIDNINNLLSRDFRELCITINDVSIDSKKKMSNLSSVVELMNAIPSIGEIDKEKMKVLKKNLRSIYWMTTSSNVLTGLGITSKGLISAIIQNIVERSKEVGQGGFKSVGALSQFIKSLVELGENTNVDRSKIMKAQVALWSLLRIYDVKGPIAYLVQQVKELGEEVKKSKLDGKNSNLGSIESMINGVASIGNDIEFKDLAYGQLVASMTLGSSFILGKLVKTLSKINDDELKKLVGNNGKLSFVMEVVQRLAGNKSTLNDIKSATQTLMQLTVMLSVAHIMSKVSKGGIDGISDSLIFLDKLDFLGQKIFTLQDSAINDDVVPSVMKNVENVIVSLSKIAMLSALSGMFVDKGKDGIVGMKTMVTKLKSLMNNINNQKTPLVVDKDDSRKIKDCEKIVNSLTKLSMLAVIGGLFASKAQDGLHEYSKVITKLKSLIKKVQGGGLDVTQEDLKKIDNITELVKKLAIASLLGSVLSVTAPLAIIGFNSMRISMTAIDKMMSTLDGITISDDLHDKMKEIGLVVALSSATILLGAVIGKIVLQRMPEILGFTLALGTFILGVIGAYNLATRGMDEALKQAENAGKLILISGATLLLGATVMMIPGIFTNALLFTLSLSIFIGSVTLAYSLASKNIENTVEISELFMKLIVKSGLILAFGATVNAFLPTGSVLGFAFSLTLLISGVIGAYTLASNMMKDTMSSAKEFAWLIGISGLTLLIPTIIMTKHPVLFATALLFALELGIFIFMMKLAYSGGDFISNMIGAKLGVGQTTDKSIDDAKHFAILIGISGAMLLLGAAIMNIDGMFMSALGFTVTLGAFLLGISAAYWGASKILGGEKGMIIAHEFSSLVVLSAATLLVGGLFMLIPNMKEATITFVITLGAFVAGITLAYGFAGKIINEKTLFLGYALSALVLVSSMALLTGGMLLMNYPDLGSNILQFLGLELLLVGGMSLILGILSVVKGKLKTGVLALIGVIACVGLSGYAMMEIVKLRDKIGGDWGGIWATIGTTFAVLGAFAAGVIGLGYLSAGTGGIGALALAAGEAALAGIIGCVFLAGKAMQEIIRVMDMASKVERVDSSIITDNIKAMLGIIWELKPFMNPLLDMMIVAASGTIASLGHMMSLLSEGIQDYANLSIPIYGENGKIVGRRNLTDADFTDAAENIRTIVTILGGTILDIYKENPDIFSNGSLGDFLGMDTPFTRVVKSCTGMGRMISKIAEGVKEMAELKVPIYKGTEKVGYRKLTDEDFNSAAINVSTIVTCLGNAILDLYENAPEGMFDSGWLGNMIGVKTPFGRVVTGCTGLGKMISTIAKGVKDMADLRIPIYGNDGKQTGTRPLDTKDFLMAALNTQLIVSCLGNSIMALGSNPKTAWMFEDTSLVFKDGTCSRFAQIVTALRGIGSLISDTAKGVKDVADMRIQKYDENGKLLKGQYEKIPLEALKPKGTVYNNVMAMMSCIPAAVMAIYDAHKKDWFEDSGWFSNDGSTSPFAKVKNCLGGLDKLVAANVKSIKSILDLKLDENQMTTLSSIIMSMMTAVPEAIMKASMEDNGKDLKPFFEDAEDISKKISSSYGAYIKILNKTIDSYSDILELSSKFTKDQSIHDLNKILDSILTQLPFSMSRAIQKMPKMKDNEISSISKYFGIYLDILNDAIDSYKKINKFKEKLEKETKEKASSIVISLSDIPKQMMRGISDTFNLMSTKNLSEGIMTFGPLMMAYKSGMSMLFDVYDEAPKDTVKYDNVINAVKGINVEIANVKNTSAFKTETEDVSKFTKSINTLDLSRAQTMTNLVTALDQMARRLGGLDKLTNTLANKLAVVLDKLVRELQISAKTINKADEMQKKRHEAIKNSITTISTLLNKPVEVNVKQVQEDLTTLDNKIPDVSTSQNQSDVQSTSSGFTGSQYSEVPDPADASTSSAKTNRKKTSSKPSNVTKSKNHKLN